MKPTWVLSEEERKQKFEGRVIKRKRKRVKTGGEDDDDESEDDPVASKDNGHVISELEEGEVSQLVAANGYNLVSKVNDMENSLIRHLIRLVIEIKTT